MDIPMEPPQLLKDNFLEKIKSWLSYGYKNEHVLKIKML